MRQSNVERVASVDPCSCSLVEIQIQIHSFAFKSESRRAFAAFVTHITAHTSASGAQLASNAVDDGSVVVADID